MLLLLHMGASLNTSSQNKSNKVRTWNPMREAQLQQHLASRQGKFNLIKFSKLQSSAKTKQQKALAQLSLNFMLIRFMSPDCKADGFGTGFIISSTPTHFLVLTCYHNVVQQKDTSYSVRPGVSYNNWTGETLTGAVYELQPIINQSPDSPVFGADIALFKTIRKLNSSNPPHIPLTNLKTRSNFIINIFGFGSPNISSLEGEQRTGKIHDHPNWKLSEISHDVGTVRGFSGAPILHYDSKLERIEVIGIHTRSDSQSNYGLKLDDGLIEWVQEEVRVMRNKCNVETFEEIVGIKVKSGVTPDESVRGCEMVNNALEFPEMIEKVNLMDLGITDETVRFVYSHFRALTVLKLSNNKITDSGLVLALQLPQLNDISAKQNSITHNFIELISKVDKDRLTKHLLYMNLGKKVFELLRSQEKHEQIEIYLYQLVDLFPTMESLDIGYAKENKQLRLHLTNCLKHTVQNLTAEIDDSDKKSRKIENLMLQLCEREVFSRKVQSLQREKQEVIQDFRKKMMKKIHQMQDSVFRLEIRTKFNEKSFNEANQKSVSRKLEMMYQKNQAEAGRKTIEDVSKTFVEPLQPYGASIDRMNFLCDKGGVACIQ